MKIKLKNYLINTLNDGSKVFVIPMNKDQYQEFSHDFSNLTDQNSMNKFADKYGFTYKDVLLDGNTFINVNDPEEVSAVRPLLALILPKPTPTTNALTDKKEAAYKCFCCKNLNIESVIEHTTPFESWNCLMIRIGEPEFAVVLKIKK